MKIHDDIYGWEGWGGQLRLGSGKCRLRIYDLTRSEKQAVMHLKPIVVIVTDVPDSTMSVRSCCSNIVTTVARKYKIDPQRMLYVEHYPASLYGIKGEKVIPERFDVVNFSWNGDSAIDPRWRPLRPPMLDVVRQLVAEADESS